MAYDHFSFYASDSPVNRDNDYLQDPSLWRDTLPQPYKMINDTIQELLMSVHDEIELRNLHKERESSVRKIPVVRDANLMMSFPESEMITVVSTDEEQYIVACGQMGIFVGKSTDSTNVAHKAYDNITNLSSVHSRGGVIFIALVIKQETVKIVVYQNHNILDVCQIDGVEDKKVTNIKLSPNVTHLSVTLAPTINDDSNASSTVTLYSLPYDQWMQQLESVHDQQIYNSPSLLFSLTPPMDSTPPPSSDPMQIMKLIQEKSSNIPLTGNSTLTNTYLQTRRQLFISQPHRKDFVRVDVDKTKLQSPLIEFLFYCDGLCTPSVSTIAIVWRNTFSLLLYPLNKKGTNVTIPSRVYYQGSHISSMAVSSDTTLVCLGLESGNITLYDIRRELVWGVQTLSLQSPVSAVTFAPSCSNDGNPLSRQQPIIVIGGCSNGTVHCIKWTTSYQSSCTMLNSDYQCSSSVKNILFTPTIPTIVTTEHEDGLLVVWEWSLECVPLCALSLPSPFKHITHSDHTTNSDHTTHSDHTSISSSSDSIYAIGRAKICNSTIETELQNGVFSWNLTTSEPLRRTCINSSCPPSISDGTLACSTITDGTLTGVNNNTEQMNALMELTKQDQRSDEEVAETIARCWQKLETFKQNRTEIQAR